MASNVELLTQSHKAVKAKKRQKVNAVVFDEDARREFLTGFHKRKLAKKEESKKRAQAREKEDLLEARRERRRVLAEQAAQNAAEVEEAYGGSFAQHVVESDQEWTGIAVPEREREYSDEEQLATVTVVEDFDPSSILLHGATTTTTTTTTSDDHNAELLPAAERRPLLPPPEKAGRSRKDREGLGKKAVRYETKAARRATQAKQRARRTEKAERAGGKAARKRAGGKKQRTRK